MGSNRPKQALTRAELEKLTAPEDAKEVVRHTSDTVVVGMGPVGLVAGLCALLRGDSVTFISDRNTDSGLGVRQQILNVNEATFQIAKTILQQPVKLLNNFENFDPRTEKVFATVYDKYVFHGMINRLSTSYQFSIGLFEKACLEVLHHIKQNNPKVTIVEINRLDKDLVEQINTDRQETSASEIRAIKALRARMNVAVDQSRLSVTGVKKINGKTTSGAQTFEVYYTNLQVADGENRSLEKAMLDVSGDNVRLGQLQNPYHAVVIFQLKTTSKVFYQARDIGIGRPELLSPAPLGELAKMGWQDLCRPSSALFACGGEPALSEQDQFSICYIGCNIPKKLYDEYQDPSTHEQAKAEIHKFAFILLRDKLPQQFYANKIVASGNALSISAFKIKFHQLNRSMVVSNAGCITFLGDGMMSPFYIAQSGLETALNMLQYFDFAQQTIKALGVNPKKDEIAKVLREYHLRAQDQILQIGERYEALINTHNLWLQHAKNLKNLLDNIQNVFEGINKLYQGFKTTVVMGSAAPVSMLFTNNNNNLPLIAEEKALLLEVISDLKQLQLKNPHALIAYEDRYLFDGRQLHHTSLLEYYKAYIAALEKLETLAKMVASRAPTTVTAGETPERFALRRINSTLHQLVTQLTKHKEEAIAVIQKANVSQLKLS